ncbi:MAG: hypothetical protein K0Q73_3133 [Paenibacillus sp.]|jgi:hypothetical protein|nr:hypothetical protein [Paenibacillus sp.]
MESALFCLELEEGLSIREDYGSIYMNFEYSDFYAIGCEVRN